MSIQPTNSLAEFLADLRFEALPTTVREHVTNVILDTVANALGGKADKTTAKVTAFASAMGGPAASTVLGGQCQSLAGATLLNGYQAACGATLAHNPHVTDHFAPCVIAPALAVAEQRRASGRSLVVAVAAGLEVAARIERGMRWPAAGSPVWHAAGVIGPLGSAAAASMLLGFDALRCRNALSLSGTQSAGTLAQSGTPTMQFNQARAGLSGLLAALLAETGFKAGPEILTAGHGGLFHLCSDGGDPEAVVTDLGAGSVFLARAYEPPPDRSDILARFRQSAVQWLSPGKTEQAIEMLAGLGDLPDLTNLFSCLRKSARTAA